MTDDHDHHADDGGHDHADHEGHDHGHEVPPLTAGQHREQGVILFNRVWEMLETPDRTPADDDQMVHAAHASRWHWSQAGEAGGSQQLAVGEWQCARVYAVVGRGEPALHHARACLTICEEAGLGDWVLAAAHEALARGSAVAGDLEQAGAWLERARASVARIAELEDREVIEADLASIAAMPLLGGQAAGGSSS